MPFLAEIRRRKVFQVAAVYAVVAWLLIQVVDVVGEPLNLPTWINAVVIVLLAVGFPVAVIFAWAFDITPQEVVEETAIQNRSAPTRVGGQQLSYLLQILVLLAVGLLVVDQYLLDSSRPTSNIGAGKPGGSVEVAVRRFPLNLGDRADLNTSGHMALAPDGSFLVYLAELNGAEQLYLRRLDELAARAIENAGACADPFVSPDAEWIACHSLSNQLLRMRVQGGRPQILVSASSRPYGSWGRDGSIAFSDSPGGRGAGIFLLPPSGGEPRRITSPEPGTQHTWPYILPDGKSILFTIIPELEGAVAGTVALASTETGDYRTLLERAYNARYAPSGHIVFARDMSLWAVPFDATTLQIAGPENRVLEGLENNRGAGQAPYTFSDDGLLVYEPRADSSSALGNANLVWVSREGRETELPIAPARFDSATLSPDGTRVAVDIDGDVWVYELETGSPTRLTVGVGGRPSPVWWPHPDGDRVVFSAVESGRTGLYWKRADGSGQSEYLLSAGIPGIPRPKAVSADWTFLAVDNVPLTDTDIAIVSLNEEPAVIGRIATTFRERSPTISPTGDWIAYSSDDTGEQEIYVRPFPHLDEGSPRQVSVDAGAGILPVWGPDGRELFYLNGTTVMRVSIGEGPTFSGKPEALFPRASRPAYLPSGEGLRFTADESGERFLMLRGAASLDQVMPKQLVAIQNWFEELARLAPGSD